MKRIIFGIFLCAAGIVGFGFFRTWFQIGANNAEGKSNVTLSVDTDKFKKDRKSATESIQGLEQKIEDQLSGTKEGIMDGALVSVKGDKLTMVTKKGKEHSHPLAEGVIITCDGKSCTAADLRTGMSIRVTTDDTTSHSVVRIEAINKERNFGGSTHEGRVISIDTHQLVMTDSDNGKRKYTHTLTAEAKVTCDGKVCTAADLKPGMKVRVTADNDEPHGVTRVEALVHMQDFEKGS